MEIRTKHFFQKYAAHRLFGAKRYSGIKFFKIKLKALLGTEYEVTGFLKNVIKSGEVFLDIGANLGQYAVRLRRRGIRLYLIEPVSSNFGILQKYFRRDENVITDRLAVSDFTGEGALSIPLIDGIRIDTQATIDNSVRDTGFSEYVTEKVRVITVDEYAKEKKLDRVDYIKCDTEGNDENVINGARKTILSHNPVIITEDILQGETLEFLASNGYGAYLPLNDGRLTPESEGGNLQQGIIRDVVLYVHDEFAGRNRKFITGI